MRRKMRVSFPKLVQEILQADKEYFNLKRETICNLIVEGLGFERISTIGTDILDEKCSIYFNLNEKNTKLFNEMLKINGLAEGEFLRGLFITYANLHPHVRERILFKNRFLRIEEAIRRKKKIKIYHKGTLQEVQPISFERNKEKGNYTCLKSKILGSEYLIEMKCIEYTS